MFLLTTISSPSIVDDDSENDEDSPAYLVESVIGDHRNETEEKESLFLILKSSYLVEKDPFTGQVNKSAFVCASSSIS